MEAIESDFWSQPCEGLLGASAALTDNTLDAKELELGLTLPALYRELMKQQNGGKVRRSSFFDGAHYHEIFINGSVLSPIAEICDFTEIAEEAVSEPEDLTFINRVYHPNRLVVISTMYGHSLLCLDYGWANVDLDSEPAITVMEQDNQSMFGYREILRVSSFSEFVGNLVYYGFESESFFMSVSSSLNISDMAAAILEVCGGSLESKSDDRYGWFNFDEYFTGRAHSYASPLTLFITLSPNRHRAGTYLFQNRKDVDYIIRVEPRTDLYTTTYQDISGVMKCLASELERRTGCSTEQLLSPHPF